MGKTPAPKQPNFGPFIAERIIRLVAELRFYLGGENYTSGRYKSTHAMLFKLEEQLRALDLDGPSAGALQEANPLPVSSLMAEICSATDPVAELVYDMKAVAKEAGAGGRNGGAAAAAQEAVARWLAGFENGRLLVWIHVGTLTSVCQRGRPLLDATRRRVAELELLKTEPAPSRHESVEHAAVCGGGKLIRQVTPIFTSTLT